MSVLAPVREAFAGDDTDAMEDALRELWRTTLDPVVAGLLVELETDLEVRRPEPRGAEWLDRPGRRVGAKLAWATRGGSGAEIAARLTQIADQELPDPRLSALAVRLLENSPSQRNVPLDTALWRVLRETRDPGTVADVASVPKRSLWVRDYSEDGQPVVKCRFAPGFNRRLDAYPEVAEGWTSAPLPASERAELTALVRARITELGRPVLPVPGKLVPLFERIVDDPRDDALRHVFADACIEAGDAERGEFITLQLMDPARRTRAATARMNAILKKRRDEWMGEAAGPTLKGSWVFERGFPHAATVGRTTEKSIQRSRGAVGWRTMRELTVATNQDAWMLLLESQSLGAATTLRGDLRPWLRALGTVWGHRLQELDLVPDAPSGVPRKAPTDLHYPALRRLRVTPVDLELPSAIEPRKPLQVLHLTVPVVGSPGLPRRFLLHPTEALAWVRAQQARVAGRIELRFEEGGTPVLEVHAKQKKGRLVFAVAASDALEGFEGLLEAIEGDVVVRRSLGR
ncbi:MAG: hypothetical protein R3F61_19895 [Myxococcota bacterium]